MKVIFVGDVHGNIDKFIEIIQPLNPDVVIQVGDFGVWPDLNIVDRATRKHGGAGDFPRYFSENKGLPFLTIFTHGNHEDMQFLEKKKDTNVLENLKYIHTGIFKLGKTKIAFLGGNYSFKHKHPRQIKPWDADTLKNKQFDILVTHECAIDTPVKVFGPLNKIGDKTLSPGSPDIREIIETSNPKYHFHGHYHQIVNTSIGNTKIVGLNSVPHPGCYFILDI